MDLNYLCIGHCCHDKIGAAYLLGGTASYAAIIAKGLQMQAMILTSVGTRFQFFDTFKNWGIPIHNKLAPETTTFENIYHKGKRTQYLLARALPLRAADVPTPWLQTPVVHFTLIADEVDASMIKAFPNSLKGATIQGWLRQWDEKGLVRPKEMEWSILQEVDIVILSDEDIRGVAYFLEKIIGNCSQVVLTHGADGATVYQDGQALFFPAFPVKEVDPTGAGDAFTTAYLIDYYKHKDIRSACIAAHCTASFIIEAKGVANLPSIDKVERRKAEYAVLFPADS